MSWVRIWIHLVFSTKNHETVLNKNLREELFKHILHNAKQKNILIDSINGYSEHAHCLFLLGKDQSLSDVVRLIKGESSHWINQNKLLPGKFQWQDDYWAVSVSEKHVKALRDYIKNQEEHHRVKSFSEEVELFMKKYGWVYLKE